MTTYLLAAAINITVAIVTKIATSTATVTPEITVAGGIESMLMFFKPRSVVTLMDTDVSTLVVLNCSVELVVPF